MKKTLLFRSSGDALVLTIIALAVVSVFSMVALDLAKTDRESRKRARIKSAMTTLQQKILELASEPSTYTGCDSITASNCQLNTDLFKRFTDAQTPIPGAQCPNPEVPCGVEVAVPIITKDPLKGNFKFHTTIDYKGIDYSIHSYVIDQEIPKEILQATEYNCTNSPGSPLFKGYNRSGFDVFNNDKMGRPICRGIPQCIRGQYISGVNSKTLAPNCSPLPSNWVDCGISQFVSGFQWHGDLTETHSCSPRIDPFSTALWWDGGELEIDPGGGPSKKPLRVTIDSLSPAFQLDSLAYLANKGVQSWAHFAATFSRKISAGDCGKIKLHNDTKNYFVPIPGSFGFCSVEINKARITFRGDALCKGFLCNADWYTITVEAGAGTAKNDGSSSKKATRQFKADPH